MPDEAVTLFVELRLVVGPYPQGPVGRLDLDVVALEPGQVDGDVELVVPLDHVDGDGFVLADEPRYVRFPDVCGLVELAAHALEEPFELLEGVA